VHCHLGHLDTSDVTAPTRREGIIHDLKRCRDLCSLVKLGAKAALSIEEQRLVRAIEAKMRGRFQPAQSVPNRLRIAVAYRPLQFPSWKLFDLSFAKSAKPQLYNHMTKRPLPLRYLLDCPGQRRA
jgi:hypothetical protein